MTSRVSIAPRNARTVTSRRVSAWPVFPIAVFVVVCAMVPATSAQTTYSYTGGGDGVSWSDASNWAPIGVPGASDAALVSFGSVTISGAITVGTISLRNTGQLFFGADPIIVDSLDIGATTSPAITGSGTITAAKLRWNAGTVVGPTIVLTGAGEVNGVSFSRILDNATLVVQTRLQLVGRMRMTDNARIEIRPGAAFDIVNGADILYHNALNVTPPVIANEGTMTKLAGSGQSEVGAIVENTGTVATEGGELQLGGGGTSSNLASFISQDGGVISFDRINPFDSASYDIGTSTFTGGGTIDFASNTTDVTLSGVYDVGTTTVTGSTVRISAGLTLPSLGTTLSVTSGSLVLDRAPDTMPDWLDLRSTLETNVPLTIDSLRIASFNDVALAGSANVTTRALSWSSGRVALLAELIVTGDSEVNGISFSRYLIGSTMRVSGDMSLVGRMRVTDGSEIVVDPGGSFRFVNGSEIIYQTAVGTPRAVLVNNGLVEKDASTGDSDVSMEITNNGTVRSLGGRLRFGGGGTSTGTFDVATDATIAFIQLFGFSSSQYELSAATFIGAGTIEFGANGTTTDVNGPYEVGRTVVSGSAVTFPAGAELFSLGSTVVVSSGSLTLNEPPAAMPLWANLRSTLVANVDITIADSVNITSNNDVAIAGAGNVTTRWMYWTSGVIETAGVVTVERQIEIEGTSFQRTLRGSRLNLRGVGSNGFLSGRMRVTDGSVFDMGPDTFFTLRDGADITYQTAAVADTARIHNEGQLFVGSGFGSPSDVSNIAPIIDNFGSFVGVQAQIVLGSTSRLINRPAAFVVSNSILDVRAAFEVVNRGYYSVLGNEPASMEFRGDLVIPPGGYVPIVNAERARSLNVVGDLTLGGELVVVPDIGDTVQVGQTLPIITADNVIGEFATVIDTLFSSVSFEVIYEPTVVSLRVVEKSGSGNPNAPLAVDDAAAVDEDGSVSIDVLANDSDPDSDPLTIASVSTPTNGSAEIVGGASITYTPAADYNGTATFTYVASDGGLQSAPATVTVMVNAVNDEPVAVDDAATTTEGVSILIDALANDTDVDGDVLIISGLGATSNGGLVAVEAGEIRYTPVAGFVGSESFSYTVEDPSAASASANVSVTVEASGGGGGPTYALTALTSFAASVATAINDEGIVVGAARNGSGDLVAWRTQGAVASEIDIPALVESIAWDINEAGTVVVSGLTADSASAAFVVTAGGSATRLTGLGGGFDIAYAITDDGAVYGVSANQDGQLRGVRFLPSLAEIHEATFAASEVFDANAAGAVAGALHQSGSATPLLGSAAAPAAGSGSGRAVAINAAGVAVGAIDGPSGTYAARWSGGNPEALGSTDGFSEAYDINDAGWVVGARGTGAGKYAAFGKMAGHVGDGRRVYSVMRQRLSGLQGEAPYGAAKSADSQAHIATEAILVTDQNEVRLADVTSAPGWTLDEARAINASGTVVGTGVFEGASQAYRLIVVSNTAPVARLDRVFAGAGQSVVIDVLSNDADIESEVRVVAVGAARFGTTRLGEDGRTVVYRPEASSGIDGFSYTIADAAGAVAEASVEVIVGVAADVTDPFLVPAYPNPFDDVATLGLFLPEEAHITAVLFDALGRRVGVLADGVAGVGSHELTVNGADLGAGRYYVRITIAGQTRYDRTAVVVRR